MITAIGNPVYDYIKTRKIETEGRVLSGCSTNAALALSRLGEKVRLVGAVGEDFKAQFNKKLAGFGIESVIVPSDETGGFSLIYYDDFGNRTLDLLGRAATIGHLDPEIYRDSKAVLIGPILGEVTLGEISSIRKNFDGLFFCDPQGLLRNADSNGRIHHSKVEGIEQALALFDIVKPNELEGKVLTGIDCRKDPYQAAQIIKSWGPKIVIVTLAELGSIIYDGRTFIDIPPYKIDLVDATGAGDTYMAGFTFEYLKTGDLRKAGCFASCVSSIMIEQVGPDFVMTESEVRRQQEMLLAQTDFKIPLNQAVS
ncbi:MAG: PfkB family carbohydrate kinase [candidate division Zixibacteria bacterium]|nr:PfkB family carbohydrate kinase [candidate division Zixibacteria bacterium]